MNLSSA